MNPETGDLSMFSGANPQSASRDTSLFSTSLPMLPHMKKQDCKAADEVSSSLKDTRLSDWEGEDAQFDEFHAIGSLLPEDEDELLAQSMGQLGFGGLHLDEDFDVFGSGGGLELEYDSFENSNLSDSNAKISRPAQTNAIAGEHPLGEHPSRTLFVRNINSSIEDSELRSLFEPYGDIRSMYTACKHRGFVMVSYYDIRAARNAKRLLHNKVLGRRNLDIHYSIPKENPSDRDLNQGTLVVFNLDPSVSNDDVRQIFGDYGEVKEIRETPYKRNHKFIEYYDIRAAEEALRSLNKKEIAGKRIKLEPSHPGGMRRNLMLQQAQGNEQDEPRSLGHQVGSLPGNLQRLGSPSDHSPLQSLGKPAHLLSPTPSASLSGLASLLDPLYAGVSPIPKGSLWSNPSLYSGTASSFDASSSNGSLFDTVSEPQSIWLSSKPFPRPQSFGTSRGRSLAHQFAADLQNNGSSLTGHGPFFASPPGPHHHYALPGSAPSGFPMQRHFSFFQEPPATLRPNFDGFTGTLRDLNATLGFRMLASPRYVPAVRIGHPEGFIAHGCARHAETRRNQMDSSMQFLLDLQKIESGEDTRTTLMLKNIPNKYTSKMMLDAINENYSGTYDFFYLPIDFKNKCNVGYAFINMLAPALIIPFYKEFNGKRWEKFHSEKVASLAYARIQGKAALISHFQNSSLMNEDKRYRPLLF